MLSLRQPLVLTRHHNHSNVLLILWPNHHPDHLPVPAGHLPDVLSKTFQIFWPGLVLLGLPCSSFRHLPARGDGRAMWEGLPARTGGDVRGEGGQIWGVWGRDDLLWL